VFGLLYDHGLFAVPIFWMISGFVFAAVYAGSKATPRDFAINRFARLYPLHLLTLLAMAALQAAALAQYGRWLIYGNNDPYHFVLQLFFASNWGFERGFSFNGPIWSVSVEVMIYLVFWLLHRHLLRRGVAFPLVAAVAFLPLTQIEPITQMARCGFFFFVGCALHSFHRSFHGDRTVVLFAAAMLGAIGVLGFAMGSNGAVRYAGIPGLFGAIMLLLAEFDDLARGRVKAACTIVGDNTYGMYLWHVPVQMVFILTIAPLTPLPALAQHSWFLVVYVAIVAILARVSFLFFERPMRDWVRKADGRARPNMVRAAQ
jgi:peptidoglycan/LPS O-acetylase OafA/YrhL